MATGIESVKTWRLAEPVEIEEVSAVILEQMSKGCKLEHNLGTKLLGANHV